MLFSSQPVVSKNRPEATWTARRGGHRQTGLKPAQTKACGYTEKPILVKFLADSCMLIAESFSLQANPGNQRQRTCAR